MNAAPLLSVTGLRVGLPTPEGPLMAVDGVTFSLAAGHTLAIVGESGSGKTMLGRAVMDLLPADAVVSGNGAVVFRGRPLSQVGAAARRRIVGREMAMVFQDPMTALNPLMRVGRQIAEGMIQHFGTRPAAAEREAAALLAEVGVDMPERRLRQYPDALSGGLRQRVAIAIALACRPRLIIADEPTTALDVTIQADILDLMDRLQRDRRMAMILISHDLAVVAGRAHDTAVMYAGRLVETAPTAQLFAAPRMPYTRALLDAVPRLSDPPQTPLKAIDGMPPDLLRPPPGCRFAPRCRRATAQCRATEPPMTGTAGSGHLYACWHPLAGKDAPV